MDSNKLVPRIVELAATISASVTTIDEILTIQGIESPSFREDAPVCFPKEACDARDAVLDATAELYDLLLEPMTSIYKHGGHNNSICLQAVSRFHIASLVPPGGQISFAEIARQIGLGEQIVRRVLRHAMTMRIFHEPEPGMVAHTKSSKTLRNPVMNDWIKCGTHEMWSASTKMLDAVQKWPSSSEPNETGFSLANDTSESLYSILGRNPERAALFANAMKIYTVKPEYNPSYIVDHYDWASLGDAQVVDIGGSQGHIAMALARRFSNLKIVVQDMEQVVQHAGARVPEQFEERVKFMAHDFFSPQTVQANVFFLRWILHNWSDKYCIRILRAQVPMLRPGATIIIQDSCMPEPGAIPLWKEQDLRSSDLQMATLFNARERTVAEWKALLQEAHPGFVLKRKIEPKGSALAILEVIWAD
ncbi:hypothetical protein HIM_08874 [Hirsutella minnesotensis 3608]|uniref:Uncharacterized protein n=1 Tax=Hirsutella minnesotensis 3608 TaxID=1043627 RepID=A0A0F7ZY25_9HYPO|nr:hypothetical protein HIM_08874 [Hirsutella minnesotensis 3608]